MLKEMQRLMDHASSPGSAILHIGMDKTGTTAIQQFCTDNASILHSNRINYPRPSGEGNISHFFFAQELGFLWNDVALTLPLAGAETFFGEPLSQESEMLLLSAEAFSCYTSAAPIQRLKEWLQSNGYSRIKILVYLRNQVDWLVGLYSEAIRWGVTTEFDSFYEQCRIRMNYARFLQEWEATFGADALIVKSYDAVRNKLLPDFTNAIGLGEAEQAAAGSYRPLFTNNSMPQILSEYVRTLHLELDSNERYDFIVNRLATGRPRFLGKLFNRIIWPLPTAFLNELPEFERINESVRTKFGIAMPGLEEIASSYNEHVKPLTYDGVQEAARLMMFEIYRGA